MVKLRKLFKIVNAIVTTLLYIALFFSLFIIVILKASGNEPHLFGYQIKVVQSGSMEPEIKTGSIIAVKTGGDMTRFKNGDVITFKTEDHILVTHRIVEVKENGKQYITKGDANHAIDYQPVIAENIVGEYTGVSIPYIGYVLSFFATREGAALVFILPGVVIFTYSIITISGTLRQMKRMIDKKSTGVE